MINLLFANVCTASLCTTNQALKTEKGSSLVKIKIKITINEKIKVKKTVK